MSSKLETLPEVIKFVDGTGGPVTTNGGITADYISLRNAIRVTILVNLTQAVGHATVIALKKATLVDGTGATAATIVVPIWENEDTAATDTLVRQTDAVSVTMAADVKKKMVVIQVDPETLGATFDVINVTVSDSSEATNFAQVTYLIETAYPDATPPAAITD